MKFNKKLVAENTRLKDEFMRLGLALWDVWIASPHDMALENRQLSSLLRWVAAYRELGSRSAMEARGLLFPPVQPDYSPEADWERFERWMRGDPVEYDIDAILPDSFELRPPSEMSDEEVSAFLRILYGAQEEWQFKIELRENLPPRLAYEVLYEMVVEGEFKIVPGGGWHIDGCGGYCPGCCQRPWCEIGQEHDWDEDLKAGEMVLTPSAREYVSPLPLDEI